MKTPRTTTAELSAPKQRKFTARQHRTLSALKSGRWIWREDIDRIAGASNGPEIIAQLRHTHLIDIDMKRVKVKDRDGLEASPGRYRLTDKGRETLKRIKFNSKAV
jgi:hypothetical protein